MKPLKVVLGLMGVLIALAIGITLLGGTTRLPAVDRSRCQLATGNVLSTLNEGMLHNVTVVGAYMVRSNDYNEVYFVAGKLRGPGMSGTDVGVWATNDNTGRAGFISADGFARNFSNWADGSKMQNPISFTDDGGQEAQACAG